MISGPFSPAYGAGLTVSTSTTSASSVIGRGNKCVRLMNLDTTNTIHVRTGINGSTVATTSDLMLRPGQERVIQKDQEHDRVAYIAAAGTPSLRIEPGEAGI
jgi:hypothetical protein